ncbi:MAG: undecaprenyl-diphosphate phosphatase [Betaproteobacteria bacterium]|nr:undecaprenyl-diphosphate phosphatase [Betaproteobacteria bacterium]MCC7218761.1 undecaprenyl-diphosphate phosphatase [Burkholderiales bacterium]
MDSAPSLLVALLLGIVEGLTEFLPISSTGHLIVAGSLLGYTGEHAKVFEIVIQAGAILAVCWEFRLRLASVARGLFREPRANRFVANLVIAFVPAAGLGLLFGKYIKAWLFAPVPVAIAFVAGAFVILWAERRQRAHPDAARIDDVDAMRWSDALKVGLAQAFALIPGTSRSGATIIGGMLFGLSRRAATEFSFFLAIPTLLAACVYESVKNRELLANADLFAFGTGFAAAFVSAFLCVRWLLRYVSQHDFTPFAWYRIAFGALILVTAWTGVVRWE